MDQTGEGQRLSRLGKFSRKAEDYHSRVPVLGKLPFRTVSIITLLIVVNICVWIGCGIVLVFWTPYFSGLEEIDR
jgi:hypothetical protein